MADFYLITSNVSSVPNNHSDFTQFISEDKNTDDSNQN